LLAPHHKEEATIHDIHPYFASFNPAIPRTFIEWFTGKGDVVLDPFCGSGTTLVEARLEGRPCIGIDVNPLACLISKVKTTPIPEAQLERTKDLLNGIIEDLHAIHGQSTLVGRPVPVISKIPDFLRRDFWFKPSVLRELGVIRAHIDNIKNKDLRDLCSVALSSIIVKVSNQAHESRYQRIDKKVGLYEPFSLFEAKLKAMVGRVREFALLAENSFTRIACQDLRYCTVEDEIADLIVTSPPYLNAWDYNLYQKFRLHWLGFDHLSLRRAEIGAHLKHSYIDDPVGEYSNDLDLCLRQMFRMLRKEGICCIVIGESTIKGRHVDVGMLLESLASNSGFKTERKYKQAILGPHFSQSRSVTSKTETILVLKKC
jgi:site-specific DNA-methyltransferase (cytosine-N4-specific)